MAVSFFCSARFFLSAGLNPAASSPAAAAAAAPGSSLSLTGVAGGWGEAEVELAVEPLVSPGGRSFFFRRSFGFAFGDAGAPFAAGAAPGTVRLRGVPPRPGTPPGRAPLVAAAAPLGGT
jgi:hypothetical protein